MNTLARECQVRGTDATGIAYNFNGRMRIYKRPLPARKVKIHLPHDVNVIMGHTRMTPQGNAQFNQNNHPFLGHVDGSSFALAHNGVLWNDKELRAEENLPLTSVETDSYVAVQLLEQQKTLDFDSLQSMAEAVEDSFVFTVLDKDTPENYDDLFSVAKAFGVSADEVQALLDYGCSADEIEEMLYDPALLNEMTGENFYMRTD